MKSMPERSVMFSKETGSDEGGEARAMASSRTAEGIADDGRRKTALYSGWEAASRWGRGAFIGGRITVVFLYWASLQRGSVPGLKSRSNFRSATVITRPTALGVR